MSNTEEVTFDAPTPKKKAAKKGKRSVAAKPEKASVPFPGLTRTACADKCNKDGCAISGRNYCAHQVKGGLQAIDMDNPAALKRLQQSRDQLDVRLDPDRFK